MYASIVLKMDNSHSFIKVIRFLFPTGEAMGNESTNNTIFFLICTCMLMLLSILQWTW
jgi:hypothetical protein